MVLIMVTFLFIPSLLENVCFLMIMPRKSYPSIMASFAHILSNPFEPITLQLELFKILEERYNCIIYDKTTERGSVNDIMQEIFSRHSKLIENIAAAHVNNFFFIPVYYLTLLCRQHYFSIANERCVNVVTGVEVFGASKKHLHLMILVVRKSRICGDQCRLIYQMQQRPAGNC